MEISNGGPRDNSLCPQTKSTAERQGERDVVGPSVGEIPDTEEPPNDWKLSKESNKEIIKTCGLRKKIWTAITGITNEANYSCWPGYKDDTLGSKTKGAVE